MKKLLLLVSLASWTQPSLGESERAGSHEVVAMVEQAAELLRTRQARALQVLRDPDGRFVWKDTYVFVVDCDADRVIANPAFPERVGGDIKQHTDYAGYPYGQDLCRTAQAPGGGWVEYFWLPPGSDVPVRKLSFVRSVPGTSFQVGAGIYDYGTTEPHSYREIDNDH